MWKAPQVDSTDELEMTGEHCVLKSPQGILSLMRGKQQGLSFLI